MFSLISPFLLPVTAFTIWLLTQFIISPKQDIYNEFIKRRQDMLDEIIPFIEKFFMHIQMLNNENMTDDDKNEYIKGFQILKNKVTLYGSEEEEKMYFDFLDLLSEYSNQKSNINLTLSKNKYFELKRHIKQEFEEIQY
jgi:hypothetical protein